ncbi:MAG TPA: glycosyltransferase family 2 protein [Opitutaceae bacterium]|nr:glycosyltransferase family 2 protein [Opitutaceae bacterium]
MAEPNPGAVDILLATYNGGRFLAEQLRSLEEQTFRNWRLIARDDGSTDGTRALLAEFQARHPGTVRLLEDGAGRLGVAGNYARLLAASTADLGLFCDQDDCWLPDKIERLRAIAAQKENPEIPFLVHSDLEVTDRNLRTVAASFWRYQHIDPARCAWSQLLVQNVVTGCACLFNAALRRAALPLPPEAIMHDWWLALVAASSGNLVWTREPTVRYRQHDANDTGAKRWGPGHWLHHARGALTRETYREKLRAYQRQAAALARHEAAPIPPPVRATLAEFAGLEKSRPYFSRVRFLRRHRIVKTGMLRNLLLFWNA